MLCVFSKQRRVQLRLEGGRLSDTEGTVSVDVGRLRDDHLSKNFYNLLLFYDPILKVEKSNCGDEN